MAINPNIALSFQAPKFEDPLNKLAQMEQIKAYRQNALAKQMEMDTAVREREMTNALRQRLASGKELGLSEAATFGKPGMDIYQSIAEAKAKEAEQKANDAKLLGEKIKEYSAALSGVSSPDQYATVYEAATSEMPQWKTTWVTPDRWTQEWNDKTVAGTQGVLERIKAGYKSKENELDRIAAEKRNKARIGAQGGGAAPRPVVVSEGQTLVDPLTGKAIFEGKPKQTLPKIQNVGGTLVKVDGDKVEILYKSPTEMTPYQQALIDAQNARLDTEGKRLALQEMEFNLKQKTADPAYQAEVARQKALVDQAIESAKAAKTSNQAKDNMASILDGFQASLDTLKDEGEIIVTGAAPSSNVYAMAANSEPGQLLGKAFGTKGQQARQQIDKLKPVYMTLLSQATGLSAQQLNSNVEFKAFMDSIAGPDTGYDAATAQIGILKKIFATKLPATDQEITDVFSAANQSIGIAPQSKAKGEGMPSGRATPSPTPKPTAAPETPGSSKFLGFE
jgi:hypothetical protein